MLALYIYASEVVELVDRHIRTLQQRIVIPASVYSWRSSSFDWLTISSWEALHLTL
jgi:hypothetical protein